MTIHEAIIGSNLARADAEVLLAVLLQKDRTWLLAHGKDALSETDSARWQEWVNRRRNGEPVAYITGMKEFFGRSFHVTPAVLIPRPATELLAEIVLNVLHAQEPQQFTREIDSGIAAFVDVWGVGNDAKAVADVGTGSGCLAVTIALERPDITVIATDVSYEALTIARENIATLGARAVEVRLGDALDPLQDFATPFLVVSNPPYIPEGIQLERDVQDYEPHGALFAGKDGTSVLTRLIAQAKAHPHCIGIILECRMDQVPTMKT